MAVILMIVGLLAGSLALIAAEQAHWVPVFVIGLALIRVIGSRPDWALSVLIASPNIQYGVLLSPVKLLSMVVLPTVLWQQFRRPVVGVLGGGWFCAFFIGLVVWQMFVDVLLGIAPDPLTLVSATGAIATMLAMWRSVVDLKFLRLHAVAQTAALLLLGGTMPLFISTAEMELEVARHGGLASQPNVLGASLSRTAFFAIALLAGRNLPWLMRGAAAAALAAGVYAQFAANSRSSVLAFAAGAGVMVLLAAEGISRRLAVALAVVCLGGLAVTLAPYSFRERALAVFDFDTFTGADRSRLDEISSGRATLNVRAIEAIESNPLIGLGSTGFQSTLGLGTMVHNTYLAVGTGGGVPPMLGLILAHLTALVVGVRATLRTRRYRIEAAATVSCAVVAVADSMGSPTLLTMQNLWAVMLCTQLPALVSNDLRAHASDAGSKAAPRPGTRMLTSPADATTA